MNTIKFTDEQLKVIYVALTEYKLRIKAQRFDDEEHKRRVGLINRILDKIGKEIL